MSLLKKNRENIVLFNQVLLSKQLQLASNLIVRAALLLFLLIVTSITRVMTGTHIFGYQYMCCNLLRFLPKTFSYTCGYAFLYQRLKQFERLIKSAVSSNLNQNLFQHKLPFNLKFIRILFPCFITFQINSRPLHSIGASYYH